MPLSVSVVIPSFNASATISKTIESIINQSSPDWEVIVVDDGSTDNSVKLVQKFVERDDRIRLICQQNSGVAIARNKGIESAKFDWLLFLDSDDWIAESTLEKTTKALARDNSLDAVHFGWRLVAPGGAVLADKYAHPLEDMFPQFTGGCVFPIHTCIIRKKLVEAVGGFDASFRLCADWDFWQRVCRCGVRFGAVREVLAYYKMQQNSLSRNVEESFRIALKIIAQGYKYDARLVNCLPQYINGPARDQLPLQQLYCTIWYAGLMIGQGRSATALLSLLPSGCTGALDAQQVADYIFESVCYPTCNLPTAWNELWPKSEKNIIDFLIALEKLSETESLAERTLAILERMIIKAILVDSVVVGKTYGTCIEATKPIEDVIIPGGAERLFCVIEIEGASMGFVELPAHQNIISGDAIKEAIDAPTAWKILGQFFADTIYKKILGNEERIAERYGVHTVEEFHEKYGWTFFLRQFWDRPSWPKKRFYNPGYMELRRKRKVKSAEITHIELAEELPDIIINDEKTEISVTVGGAVVSSFVLPLDSTKVKAQTIRAKATELGGLELCRVCVRQALIGKPVNEETLKQRLAQAIKDG